MRNIIHDVLWPDASLESVTIDYDAVFVRIRGSTGTFKDICCRGYIGYKMVGCWDEMIIDRAELVEDDDAIRECAKAITDRMGNNWGEAGSPARNTRTFAAFRVHFIDSSVLAVVAGEFSVVLIG